MMETQLLGAHPGPAPATYQVAAKAVAGTRQQGLEDGVVASAQLQCCMANATQAPTRY